jgi:eukaryotic-like serine/threonine-protein kinase
MNPDRDEPNDPIPPADDGDTERTVRGHKPRGWSEATTQLRVDSAGLSTIPANIAAREELSRIWRPGARVDRYELIQQIGEGGMSVVWSARDIHLDREVAVKLSAPELHVWLLGEARAMARLAHPNVVSVYDVGETAEGLFIAMERIDGGTLSDWLSRTPRSWPDILAVYIAAGHGLAAAHHAGLVHRDFKPQNVLVGADGIARVSDFGLAVPFGETVAEDTHGSRHRAFTEEGTLVGTPAYMSPEQLLGQQLTARSDQFSFCLALYEALQGVMPFGAPSDESPAGFLLGAMADDRPVPPSANWRVPEPLHRVILRGLACDPDDRWPSMDVLVSELEHCLSLALR